jgi:hypothetical protein
VRPTEGSVAVRDTVRGRGEAGRLIDSRRKGGMFSLFERELSSSMEVRNRLALGVFSGVSRTSPSVDSTGDAASSTAARLARLPRTVLRLRAALLAEGMI